MPTQQALQYQPLTHEQLDQAYRLSVQTAWPHRRQDWEFALELGHGEAVWDEDTMVGVAMCWPFRLAATIGLIIVDQAYRGHRIGSNLVQRALQACGDQPVILHATPDGAGVYARYGFEAVGTVRQHQGQLQALPPAPGTPAPTLKDWRQVPQHDIIRMDDHATGMGRHRLIQNLLAQTGTQGVVASANHTLTGYAVIRDFGRGRVVGPVVANDATTAAHLIRTLLEREPGGFIRLDIPNQHHALQQLAEQAGLAHVDTVTLMIRGETPITHAPLQTYALASQAYG